MSGVRVLMEGVAFGESPRWHDGRLWFSDWGAQEVVAVGEEGNRALIVRVEFRKQGAHRPGGVPGVPDVHRFRR
jgi:sugar lactone lactonase YvrE